MGNKCSMPELPEDIISDILSRLSVRSLLRFRCVSKQWLSLVSDHSFISKHLNHRKSRPEKDHVFLISRSGDFYMLNLRSPVSKALRLVFPPEQKPDQCSLIWGSCDGLLLLSSGNQSSLFLVNPSTRESKIVPRLPFAIEYIEWSVTYALGYDLHTCSYKVLRISKIQTGTFSFEYMVLLYNLRTNSWRTNENCPRNFSPLTFKAVHLNGALHWLRTSCSNIDKTTSVISFDLGDESFSCSPFPGSLGVICETTQLNILGDCLCVFVSSADLLVVWVMKEYGVDDSWTKFTISYIHDIALPLSALRTGKIVMDGGEKIVLFCLEDEKGEELLVEGLPACSTFPLKIEATTYVESLVQLREFD